MNKTHEAAPIDTDNFLLGNLYELNPSLASILSANGQFFGGLFDSDIEEMMEYYDDGRNNAAN